MHPHITLPDLQPTSSLTRHPSMSTFSFEMVLELGRPQTHSTFIGTRRHADDGTVVGLRRDLVHEIERATQLAGLGVQWRRRPDLLHTRPHRASKRFMGLVGIFKNFHAAPVADNNSVLALYEMFCQVAFSQCDATSQGTVHDPSNLAV